MKENGVIIENSTDLLKECKRLIELSDNKDMDYISLNSIVKILTLPSNLDKYANMLYTDINKKYNIYKIKLKTINFKKFKFTIDENGYDSFDYCFDRKNNDWYINKISSDKHRYMSTTTILYLASNTLKEFDNDFKYYIEFNEKLSNMKEPLIIQNSNTNLSISLDANGIHLYEDSIFKITYDIFTNSLNYDEVPSQFLNLFYKKEKILTQKIYFPITECPEYMQTYLKQVRKDELAKPKYIEPIPNETNVELAKQQNKTSNSSNNQKKKKFKNIFKKH